MVFPPRDVSESENPLRNRLLYLAITIINCVVLLATVGQTFLGIRRRPQPRRKIDSGQIFWVFVVLVDFFRNVLAAAAPQRMGSRATLLEVYDVA